MNVYDRMNQLGLSALGCDGIDYAREDLENDMSRPHWHVVVNTPGYLPEGDSRGCATWEEVVSQVKWEVDDIVESQEEDEEDPWQVVSGKPEDGFVRLGRRTGLGLVVDAVACSDSCCAHDEEGN